MVERSYMPGSTEARLAALIEQAEAFAANLDLTRAQIAQLVKYRSQIVCATLDRLHAGLATLPELPSATRLEVKAAVDALRAVLARGAASSATALEEQRHRIADACAEFDGDVVTALSHARRRFDGAMLRALRRHRQAREALDMEMKIAAACLRLLARHRGPELEQRRRELAARIADVRSQLEERRARLAEQRERSATLWRELDAGMRASVDAVGADLDRLLA